MLMVIPQFLTRFLVLPGCQYGLMVGSDGCDAAVSLRQQQPSEEGQESLLLW